MRRLLVLGALVPLLAMGCGDDPVSPPDRLVAFPFGPQGDPGAVPGRHIEIYQTTEYVGPWYPPCGERSTWRYIGQGQLLEAAAVVWVFGPREFPEGRYVVEAGDCGVLLARD